MSNSIRSITEEKISSYLSANLTGVTVHKGITDEIRGLPIVIAHAANASKPSAFGSGNLGNYRISLNVYIYSSADDETLQTHRDRVEKVLAILTDQQAVKTHWGTENGQLYAIAIDTDDEGMQQRRYGNLLSFTLFAVMPPEV